MAGMAAINWCRLCGGVENLLFSVEDEDETFEMLHSLASMELAVNDQISNKLCTDCQREVRMAYEVQKKVLQVETQYQADVLTEFLIDNHDVLMKILEKQASELSSGDVGTLWPSTPGVERSPSKHKCNICFQNFHHSPEFVKHLQQHIDGNHPPGRNILCEHCGDLFTEINHYEAHLMIHKQTAVIAAAQASASAAAAAQASTSAQASASRALPSTSRAGAPLASTSRTGAPLPSTSRAGAPLPSTSRAGASLPSTSRASGDFPLSSKFDTHKYDCYDCPEVYLTMEELADHVKANHKHAKPYMCDVCKDRFALKHVLTTHKVHHKIETPYVCVVCGAPFKFEVSLQAHQLMKHSVEVEREEFPLASTGAIRKKSFR